MAGKRAPWDRQDGESSASFQAFIVYRDMGPKRSLRAAATKGGISSTQMITHSRRNEWVKRVAAWDRRKDQARTRAELSELEKMHQRHIRASMKLQDLTLLEMKLAIKAVQGKLDACDLEGAEAPDKIATTLDKATKIERLARGESTERIEGTLDLSRLSVEDLRELKRLRDKMRTEGNGDDDGTDD